MSVVVRQVEPGSKDHCPNGTAPFGKGEGRFHNYQRVVRDHPTLPGRQQDAMICSLCDDVFYDWATFSPPEESER